MDVSEFEDLAEKTLEGLFDALDEAIGDDADVDIENGILTVELEDGRQYVINKHTPNKQIWLSSPISGAAHYQHDGKSWVSTRGGDSLMDVLNAEMRQIAGRRVALKALPHR